MNNKKKIIKMLKDKVGCYPFLAEPFHCDCSKRLMMGHLGNHLLNAADFHSSERGFGMAFLNGINKTWVLSRLAIEMEEMPPMYAKFNVETWVESAMRFFTNRNFKVVDSDNGKVYGYGRSVWAMIDTETRQPADLLGINKGTLLDYVEKGKECPIAKSSRVNVGAEAPMVGSFLVKYTDIDINGHLNSVKYIEHVLDLFDLDWHNSHPVRRLEIAYVAEAHCGDTVKVYREKAEEDTWHFRLCREGQDGQDEVEICRTLVKF